MGRPKGSKNRNPNLRKGMPGKRWDIGPLFVYEDRGYKTPCWIWKRYVGTGGYGRLTHCRKQVSAHVYFWKMVNGPIPEGKELDHLCRVRACCRPEHLEPVTRRVNVNRGSTMKVTDSEVSQIIDLCLLGPFSRRSVAAIYGITHTHACHLVLGKRRSYAN